MLPPLPVLLALAALGAPAPPGTDTDTAQPATPSASPATESDADATSSETTTAASPPAEGPGEPEQPEQPDGDGDADADTDAKPGHELTLVPGLEYWLRGEGRFVENFNAGTGDPTGTIRQRARLHIDASYGPARLLVQVQDARTWGFEASPVSNDANTDLHQGYLQVGADYEKRKLGGEIRLGRQEIPFGSQRLISARPWNPVGQSFDAVRVRGHFRAWSLDTWFAVTRLPQTVTIESPDPADEPEEIRTSMSFMGGAQLEADFTPGFVVAAQLLGVHQERTPEDPITRRTIINGGLRMHGAPTPAPGLRYDIELYYQAGQELGRRHEAWAATALVDYTFAHKTKPTLHAGYALASGQTCNNEPGDGATCDPGATSTEFHDFLGRRHFYLGRIDLALRRNIRDLRLGYRMTPHKTLRFLLTYHFFQLHNPQGMWWRTAVKGVGQGWAPGNFEHNLGSEVDFFLVYSPWKDYINIIPGYSIYIPMAAGRVIGGGSDPQHFAYLWLRAKF